MVIFMPDIAHNIIWILPKYSITLIYLFVPHWVLVLCEELSKELAIKIEVIMPTIKKLDLEKYKII